MASWPLDWIAFDVDIVFGNETPNASVQRTVWFQQRYSKKSGMLMAFAYLFFYLLRKNKTKKTYKTACLTLT